jgi:alpha-methylacyl-CoA racemase
MLSAMRAAGQWSDERGTNLFDGSAPDYGVYECADGRFVAVAALEPQFYTQLIRGLGLDHTELPDRRDPGSRTALREVLAARFASRPRDHWTAVFTGTDACVTPVLSVAEAAHDAHLADRATWVTEGDLPQPAPAPRFSRTPPARPQPGPPRVAATAAPLTWATVTGQAPR